MFWGGRGPPKLPGPALEAGICHSYRGTAQAGLWLVVSRVFLAPPSPFHSSVEHSVAATFLAILGSAGFSFPASTTPSTLHLPLAFGPYWLFASPARSASPGREFAKAIVRITRHRNEGRHAFLVFLVFFTLIFSIIGRPPPKSFAERLLRHPATLSLQ